MFTKYLDVTTVTKMPTGERERAESGFTLIAFSIDFSRLAHAAFSIKIPGPKEIRKMTRFLYLRLGLYYRLKRSFLKIIILGLSNDLMVKMKISPTDYRGSRPSNFLVTTFDVKLTALRCDLTVCAVHILARSWHLILKCTKGRLKRLNSSSVVINEFEILLKYFPPD